MAHQKQLCLFCLRHPMGMECWTLNKEHSCTIDGCGKPHHKMLNEVLKAGEYLALPGDIEGQTAGSRGRGPGPDNLPEAGTVRGTWNRF